MSPMARKSFLHKRKVYNPTIICNCAHCGAIIGRKKTDYIRSKTKRFFCGKLCYSQYRRKNAKDKVSQSRYYARKQFWSEYDRRNTVCSHCLGNVGKLEVHHRDNNPLNNAIDNLEGLCLDCHIGYHTLFGYSLKTEAQ